MDEKFNAYYDFLVDNEFFTQDELNLISCINGCLPETLNEAVFARYGYRDVEDLREAYDL